MRDINDVELHDVDYIKLSRHSKNVYWYFKKNKYFKKITDKQKLETTLFTRKGKIAVVKVDKRLLEKETPEWKKKKHCLTQKRLKTVPKIKRSGSSQEDGIKNEPSIWERGWGGKDGS